MKTTSNNNNSQQVSNNVAQQVQQVFNNYSEGVSDKKRHPKPNKPNNLTDTANKYSSVIDSKSNRKVADFVLDSTLRGFKANCETFYNNRNNPAVKRMLQDNGIPANIFKSYKQLSDLIKQYGVNRFVNKKGVLCSEKVALGKNVDKVEYYKSLGYDIVYYTAKDGTQTAKALAPCFSWSVASFRNMVKYCVKQQEKETKAQQATNNVAPTPTEEEIAKYLEVCLAISNK